LSANLSVWTRVFLLLFALLALSACSDLAARQDPSVPQLSKLNTDVPASPPAVDEGEATPAGAASEIAPSVVEHPGAAHYRRICIVCHDPEASFPASRGAPRLGDFTAWEPRRRKGVGGLALSVISPPHGQLIMPRADLSDDEILLVIGFMLEQAEPH
jgi:cytochrome c5